MVTIKIMGGLGNQMFQYAIGRAISVMYNEPLRLDLSIYRNYKNHPNTTPWPCQLNKMNTNYEIIYPNIISRLKFKFYEKIGSHFPSFSRKCSYIIENPRSQLYDPTILTDGKGAYICGYFSSEKYFKDIDNIIRNDFRVITVQDEVNKEMEVKIRSTTSVCIHIRRGDYVSKYNTIYKICSADYYFEAMRYISNKVVNPVYFIFSDDIAWAKTNLNISAKHYFVDINGPDKGIEDFRLMMNCDHFIIANSSFSWWAAYLGNNPHKIVIAPIHYFNDDKYCKYQLPENWIKIDN